jgi:hypothetical protein
MQKSHRAWIVVAAFIAATGTAPAAAAAATSPAGTSALSQSAGPAVEICGQGPAVVRPSRAILTCADHAMIAEHLHWSAWTGTRATATGIVTWRPGPANSAHWDGATADFTLTHPAREHGHGLLFTRLDMKVTGATPARFLRNVMFSEAPARAMPAALPASRPAAALPSHTPLAPAAASGTLGYSQIEGYWEIAGGPSGADAQIAAAITGCESSYLPGIIQLGEPYSTTGWGLWQITPGNSVPSEFGSDYQLLDPWNNAEAAVWKFNQAGGFSPWTTYVDGCYTNDLQSTGADPLLTDPGEYAQINSAPSGTPSSPAADPGGTFGPPVELVWAGPGGSSHTTLYAHAHGSNIQIQNGTSLQDWSRVNQQSWTNLSNTIVEVNEWEAGATGECLNVSAANHDLYLDDCDQGDTSEEFWLESTGTVGNYWLINVATSEAAGENYFMTASSFAAGADVVADPAGQGSLAVWFVPATVVP